jgi:hypothetical protein
MELFPYDSQLELCCDHEPDGVTARIVMCDKATVTREEEEFRA